ncbi:MAG: sulfate adenylyltransferase subunit CysN [Myxococcota bacterium]
MAPSRTDAATHADYLDTDIETYLERHENKDLLRFVAVGSVDDGKSTLIGRLLVDTDQVYEDQLADAHSAGDIDLARITDGLKAEREQGITIDVAYRYFTTPTRKFIIADTPGHVQYTRNMATGASTSDLAIILIDARLGVLQQSRRHAYIASLLGIPHLVVAVNKMDLVDYDRATYDAICDDFRAFADQLTFEDVTFIPISALVGDNVVNPSDTTPWYEGKTMLEHLQTVDLRSSYDHEHFRFPVQYVIRPHLDYRGFAGQVSSGIVRPGDPVMVLPSGKTSRVESIDTFDGPLDAAFAPLGVTLCLEDEIDVSRGDVLVHPADQPRVSHHFEAMMVWMSETPLDPDKAYLVKHTTRYVRANIDDVRFHVNLDTLADEQAETLALNDIGCVSMTCHRPLYFDAYQDNRATGAFILIDSLTNDTVAAGMIRRQGAAASTEVSDDAFDLREPRSGVSARERATRMRQEPTTLWMTGLPGSGRAAFAFALERRLFDLGHHGHVLGRHADARETARVARHLNDAGVLSLCVADAPTLELRDALAEEIGPERFVEVHVTSDDEVEGFEPPQDDTLAVCPQEDLDGAVEAVVDYLREHDRLHED